MKIVLSESFVATGAGGGVSPVFISPMVPINDIFRSSVVDLLLTSAERNGVKRERAYSLLTNRLQGCLVPVFVIPE